MDLQQIFARVKSLTASFTPGQLASMAMAFVLAVGIVGGSAWWLNQPTYALLFADMDSESAAQMITKLKTLKVAYKLDEGGRGIRVPASRVDELRLELTSDGMPSSGRVGFEIFDRTAFGATEFLEQVNYRRALEGEIARTIATISEVASARVHIAMGKDSLFGESRPAKASVVLKLRNQRTVNAGTISGISNLVAASVEGLRPESVVILDSFGRPLARPNPDDDDAGGAAQVERQQRIEREMSSRVVALLEPVVGAEHVRVNVAVKLNPQSQEETEERWDPNTVVRSRQMTTDASTGGSSPVTVAGSRGNMPSAPARDDRAAGAAAPAAAASTVVTTGPSTTRNAETTNYEVSRTTRRTIQPAGDVARVSVAVILDDDQAISKGKDGSTQVSRVPRKPEDLQKIQGLVAAAVGLEPDRGDQLTVENVSFEEAPVETAEPAPFLERYTPQIWEGSRIVAIAVVAIIALLFIIRPMVRTLPAAAVRPVAVAGAAAVAGAIPAVGTAPRTVADLESEIEAKLDAAATSSADSRRLPVLARRVSAISQKEPENVAKLLRGWMADSDR